jgi:hypothetical protein
VEDLEARVAALEMLVLGTIAVQWTAGTLDTVLDDHLPANQMQANTEVFRHYERMLLTIRELQASLGKREPAGG